MIFKSHFISLIFAAIIISTVLGTIKDGTLSEKIKYGVSLFLSFVFGSVVFAWIMYILR